MPPRWAKLHETSVEIPDGLQYEMKSSRPCHAYLRWSLRSPSKELITVIKRGVPIACKPRYTFTDGADVEQVEPGDTLLHTFIVTPWPQCQRRHYFYWATIAGEKSVSSTSMLYDIRHGDETTTNFLCTPNIPIAVYGFHYNPPFQQNYGNYILARNADYGTVVSIPSATPVGQMRGDDPGGYAVFRNLLTFNTSILPKTTKVISATLFINFYQIYWTSSTLLILDGRIVSDSLIPADYSTMRPRSTIYGSLPNAGQIPNIYIPIPLNWQGLRAIKKEGVTKFILRMLDDYDIVMPPYFNHAMYKDNDPIDRPYLQVNYHPCPFAGGV